MLLFLFCRRLLLGILIYRLWRARRLLGRRIDFRRDSISLRWDGVGLDSLGFCLIACHCVSGYRVRGDGVSGDGVSSACFYVARVRRCLALPVPSGILIHACRSWRLRITSGAQGSLPCRTFLCIRSLLRLLLLILD